MKYRQIRIKHHTKLILWCISLMSILSLNVFAEEQINETEQVSQEASNTLSQETPTQMPEQGLPESQVSLSVEELKKQVIKLNRDLFILEEDLLFPANTQVVVYLSFSTGKFINLDSVTLKIDDEIVASHLYTDRQLKALKRGGMQRLYMGNLKTGEHEITAVLNGIGPNKEAYKLAASSKVVKDTDIKALEIRIEDQSATYQPSVSVIEWEE